jgi:shikimate dehydrogenase
MFKRQSLQEFSDMTSTQESFKVALSGLRINSSTAIAAVIGDPVKHSLSPVIHNVGFKSLGIDWVYVACEVKEGEAQAALDAMKVLGLRGLSVTMPHKTAIASLVDSVSLPAQALHSVNTVEVAANGSLVGHSTDGDGLVASLKEQGVIVQGQAILILGAGGAARSVIDALQRHDCREIFVANRSLEHAQSAVALAPEISNAVSIADAATLAEAAANSDIIINATSVGMTKSREVVPGNVLATPIPIDLIRADHIVMDLVYHPIETELLRLTRSRGALAIDGLGMLVHQAALQQQIWTGLMPNVSDMYQAALQALA